MLERKERNYSPQSLYKRLSRTVVGQDDYLKKLSNTIWLHNQRLTAEKKLCGTERFPKHNLLVVGPSGSGKTLAVSILAEMYGFDVVIVNGTDFTGTGWRGRDVNDMIKELYIKCDRSIARTEQGIVIIDEIDKLIMQNIHNDDPSFSAENSLLKVIEGMDVSFSFNDRNVMVSSKNILFICAGAFEGIEYDVKRRLGMKKMGFKTEEEHYREEPKSYYPLVTRQDLMAYGAGIQFLGRFSDIAYLEPLDETDLSEILLKSDASVVSSMDRMLDATRNVNVEIDEDGARAVARAALKEGTGARGLSQIITPKLQDAIFNITDLEDESVILITGDEHGEILIECMEYEEPESQMYSVQENEGNGSHKITCAPKKNRVENYADYILSAGSSLTDATIRELRAAHALICSVVLYLLLDCREDDRILENVIKLLNHVSNPDEHSDEAVFEWLIKDKNMDFNFYFSKFLYLDPSRESAKIAMDAAKRFALSPKCRLKSIGA